MQAPRGSRGIEHGHSGGMAQLHLHEDGARFRFFRIGPGDSIHAEDCLPPVDGQEIIRSGDPKVASGGAEHKDRLESGGRVQIAPWPERAHPRGWKILRPQTARLHHTLELRRSRGAQCQRLTRHCGFVCCQRATCGCPDIAQVIREISRASYCKRNSRHSAEVIMQAAIINSIIFRTPSFLASRPRGLRPQERPATALKAALSRAVHSRRRPSFKGRMAVAPECDTSRGRAPALG